MRLRQPLKSRQMAKQRDPINIQTSEAIPRAEREVVKAPVTAEEVTQAETRESVRRRKPKLRE
jgi:hypothetical protein